MVASQKLRILLEMRPALDGFAGIPQESRLLFRGLKLIESLEIEGLIQSSGRLLAAGTPRRSPWFRKPSESKRLNRYSRVIVSMAEAGHVNALDAAFSFIKLRISLGTLAIRTLLGLGTVELSRFESQHFSDFVWRALFAKTLPASDFQKVAFTNQRICSIPWNSMHTVGLNSLMGRRSARYPKLDTKGFEIFICQTPYPALIRKGTALVVRYHDALPVFMPHTIPDKSRHQATHFHALSYNVKSGAFFACVSEATRKDLLKLFPEAETRSVTIHNMVSHHYFQDDSPPERIPTIVRARLAEGDLLPKFFTIREKESFYRKALGGEQFRYLLVVSTVEPRKNHLRLLAAWEILRAENDPNLKLVIVGALGWDNESIIKGFWSWIDRGELFVLNSVPSADLRALYRHALATVCPSYGEGFDFSGVEAMRSGGVVLASDIPVHREVYDDAAIYFDPYATSSLVEGLRTALYAEDSAGRATQLRKLGAAVAARYLPEVILPKWESFLAAVAKGSVA